MNINVDVFTVIRLITSLVFIIFFISAIMYSCYIFYLVVLYGYKYKKLKHFRQNLYVGQHCYVFTYFNDAEIIGVKEETVTVKLYTKYFITKKESVITILEDVNKQFIYPKT